MKFEILAPAGSMESLVAGVRCGANAVYLGGQTLNARRNAGNFDDFQLNEAALYCRQRGVKVYLTLNTLVGDGEFSLALSQAEKALKSGVDGFIIQDMGLAFAIHKAFPNAHLHASTQCSVLSPSGFKALERAGFCRAVVPREMTAEEIMQVRAQTDMELEMFVHGALCMCVSGQCYLSSAIGGRSGNRGLCAQPCRLPFSADNSKSCDLSLKDLSLIDHLKEIGDIGVLSLKIEGRMKRPEYVAAAVTAVKKAVDLSLDDETRSMLQRVFSRSGFTDGYFTEKTGAPMFGVRRKDDVTAAAGALKTLSHLYDKEKPLVPVDMTFVCREGEKSVLTATVGSRNVTVLGDIPEKALNRSLSADEVKNRLAKLGSTQYWARDVRAELDDGLMLSAAAINAMRRSAVEKLDDIPPKEVVKNDFQPVKPELKNSVKYYTARFLKADQIPKNHPFKRIFLPIWTDVDEMLSCGAGVEIPRGLFGVENKVREKLAILKKAGVNKALCGSLSAVELAKEAGLEVFSDFSLNIFNSNTASLFPHPIVSFELSLDAANRINAADTGCVVYGRMPLMLTRNCPVKAHIGCEKCKKHGSLTDRKGYSFPVVCSPYPCVEMLNSVPLYMGDRMNEVKTDFAHFYFSVETPEEVNHIVSLFETGAKADFQYTRGLYQRGAL